MRRDSVCVKAEAGAERYAGTSLRLYTCVYLRACFRVCARARVVLGWVGAGVSACAAGRGMRGCRHGFQLGICVCGGAAAGASRRR